MLPKFSVKKPYTIMVSIIMIIVLGIISFTSMSTNLLPKMDLPYAIIMTTDVGASPEKIELNVTKPIEQAVATVSNVKNITSTSSENSSMVVVEFTDNVNMDSALIEINSRIDLIKSSLPEESTAPTILKLNPDMMPILVASVDVENISQEEISALVSNEILPKLEKTNGVASVSASGLIEEKIKIELNQEKIDEINNKVLANLDSELAKSQDELNNAKLEIEKGKQELEKQTKEQSQKLVDGSSAIEQAEEQISKAESELKTKENELSILKNTLDASISKINEQEQNIKLKIDELSNKERTDLEQIMLDRLNDSLKILQESKKSTLLKLDELNAGLAQLSQGKTQLTSKKSELENQKKQLEVAKITLSTQLSTASSTLTSSEAELEKGQKEFESARDEAYKNASLDGIITQSMIANVLKADNFEMPAGTVESNGEKISVKIGEKFSSIDEIKNLTLFSFDIEGLENVTLNQLADITVSDNTNEIYAKVNGNNAILITFQKQSTASTTNVSKEIKNSLAEIEKDNSNIHFTPMMDQGVYIDIVIGSVLENLLYGGILAVIVLFLFLSDIRPTLIVALSIPISLTFAIALMYFTGVTINIMSLSGLALGVGMLVDNSIVVIENIYRMRNNGVSLKEAAIKGASSVAGAIFASTLTTICVFLPIIFVQGVTRQLFSDMGLTIAYSLLASLIVALTLIPAMASSIFKKSSEKEHRLFNKVINIYEKILSTALKFKPFVLVLAIVILILSGFWATRIGTEFIPEMESTQMSLTLTNPKESTFEDLKNNSNLVIEKLINNIDDIQKVGAIQASSASIMSSGSNSKTTNMYLILKEDKKLSNSEIKDKILELTKDINCEINVSSTNMNMSALGGSGVQVDVTGDDLNKLQNIANDIANLMNNTEGLIEIDNGIPDADKEIKIVVDKNKAMKYGLTTATIFKTVSEQISNETTATEISMDSKDYPVVVIKSDKKTITSDNLATIELDGKENNTDVKVKLSDVVSINDSQTLSSISHNNSHRYISVTATVDSTHNIGLVSNDLQEKINNYEVPSGYSVKIEGQTENINKSLKDLAKMILLAVLFIYLIMVAQFQSLLSPFIIMFTIPLAYTGGLLALGITGTPISIISMIGFLILSGIVVNNGIVLIDCINQLRENGKSKKDAIIEAGKTRLRPILMTALTTILGLFTLALGIGSGAEMLQPLGIVTIGGLAYATLLTLIVVPCMYDLKK